MKTFKVTGKNYSVTFSALGYMVEDYFGTLCYRFFGWDFAPICSFPTGEVTIKEI